MASKIPTPHISEELLIYLELVFPNKIPTEGSPEEWFRLQGEQRVIQKLRSEYTRGSN